ncbi:kinesin-like protein KIF24 isoform X1 [Oncorhynchus tshawytscha]|uniref:Kinesin motor domain-containing protein n=1 Tax=Oncorhynchus tshawytscha TaxID=74940 RepID=A0A8C8MBM0_ONCTS|nr:kinesin-like protein KIF24 isoform X1 [Oncorhynchus tshawytscha]
MTSCLYECLREVGLQRHYPCFTAMGLRRAGHLSLLTMGDYSSVGVHSMGDRARLFHLVQLVKSLEEEEEEDHGGHDDDRVVMTRKTFTSGSKVPACRQLDFDGDGRLSEPKRGWLSDYDSHRGAGVHPFPSPNTGVKPQPRCDLSRGSPIHKTQISGTPMRSCPHKQTVRRTTVHRSNSKVTQRQGVCIYKEGTTIGSGPRPEVRREADGTSRRTDGTSRRTDEPTYMYTSRRTIGCNYGLTLSSPVSTRKEAGEQRISVCVRKRPLTNAENRRGEADVVTAHDGDSVVVHESKEAVDLTQYILQHRFNYDEVFGEESSNVDVYLKTAFPLIQHVLNGGKATCFAYGQTGAGKTHTMLGCPPQRQGLYALAARDIFTQLHSTQDCGNSAVTSHVYVNVSFFEIYCGQLYDLLDRRKRLFAREDGHQVVQIAGLREVTVESVNSLLEVILWGTGERTQGVSGVNPVSSRSHALLQIQLRDSGHRATGRMSFVDLAGSERAADSRDPDRLSRMEGAEINQSLLALKECIRSLDQEQSHTPFRQSKLTQVLKDSFVGDSKTCMIANVSPGHLATKHTLNTLRYADRVKELRGGGGRRRPTVTPSPSPEHDQTSSIGTSASRGKSPPKGVKLGGHREAPNVTGTPARRLAPGGALLCSTPKGQGAGEGFGRGREDLCLEHTTPVRGSLGRGLWRRRRREGVGEREVEKKGHRKEREKTDDSNTEQDHGVAWVTRQRMGEGRTTLWEIPREERATTSQMAIGKRAAAASCLRGAERQRTTTSKGEGEGRRWIEQDRIVGEREREKTAEEQRELGEVRERDRRTSTEWERERETETPRELESEKERERHLRRYHQQLQQMQWLQQPLPASPSVCRGVEELLAGYRATAGAGGDHLPLRGEGTAGVTVEAKGRVQSHLSNNTSQSHCHNGDNDDDNEGDNDGSGEHILKCLVPGVGSVLSTISRLDDRGTGGGGVERGSGDEWGSPKEEERRGRWAWPECRVVESEEGGRWTGAVLRLGEEERLTSSLRGAFERRGWAGEHKEGGEEDMLLVAEWSTEEEGEVAVNDFTRSSTDSNSDNDSFYRHCSHHAPAERPLSPPPPPAKLNDLSLESKHINQSSSSMCLHFQNVPICRCQQGIPLSPRKRTALPGAELLRLIDPANPLLSFVQTGRGAAVGTTRLPPESQNNSGVVAQMPPSSPPHCESSGDSSRCTMDPLSLSLLQVDRLAATDSFLCQQVPHSTYSPSLLPREGGKGKGVADSGQSLVPTLVIDGKSGEGHMDQRRSKMDAAPLWRMAMTKPSAPVVSLVSVQDQRGILKTPAQLGREVLGS